MINVTPLKLTFAYIHTLFSQISCNPPVGAQQMRQYTYLEQLRGLQRPETWSLQEQGSCDDHHHTKREHVAHWIQLVSDEGNEASRRWLRAELEWQRPFVFTWNSGARWKIEMLLL